MCPNCCKTETVSVSILDGAVTCSECDFTATATELRLLVAIWGQLLPWVESLPARKSLVPEPQPVAAEV